MSTMRAKPLSIYYDSSLPGLDDYFPSFQPKVSLSDGGVACVEVLGRYLNAKGEESSVGPIFFNETVATDYKRSVDWHIRQRAIERFSGLNTEAQLAINIAPDWVGSDVDTDTLHMVERAGLAPSRVVIELTERSGSLSQLERLVKYYRQQGFAIAIDDFGTGASQLDRLIALQPDYIKFDMSLFKSAARGEPAADVLLAMAQVAGRAGCQITCEGVETESELHFAIDCGADFVQGWLFDPAGGLEVLDRNYTAEVVDYKRSYLSRKSERLSMTIDHNHAVAESIKSLVSNLVIRDTTSADTRELWVRLLDFEDDLMLLRSLGVLRLYFCNASAEQVSENIELGVDGVALDPSPLGCNWSHRPYYPLLLAMAAKEPDHIVVSDSYRDLHSRQLCRTHGVFIEGDRVLLIDVLVQDEVLFVSD